MVKTADFSEDVLFDIWFNQHISLNMICLLRLSASSFQLTECKVQYQQPIHDPDFHK